MEIVPLHLPIDVSVEPKRHLSAEQMSSLVEAVRRSSPALAAVTTSLGGALGQTTGTGPQEKAETSASRLDRYDWFFLVERLEEDSDLSGLTALHRTMTDYSGLLGQTAALTELEEATLSEAVQAIVENYGELT